MDEFVSKQMTDREAQKTASRNLVSLFSSPENILEDRIEDINLGFQSFFGATHLRLAEQSPNFTGIKNHLNVVQDSVEAILKKPQGTIHTNLYVTLSSNSKKVSEILDTIKIREEMSEQKLVQSRIEKSTKKERKPVRSLPLVSLKQQSGIFTGYKKDFIEACDEPTFDAAAFFRIGNKFFLALEEYRKFLSETSFEIGKLTTLENALNSIGDALKISKRNTPLEETEKMSHIEKFERKVEKNKKQLQRGVSVTLSLDKVDLTTLSDGELRQLSMMRLNTFKNTLGDLIDDCTQEGIDELFLTGKSLIESVQRRYKLAIEIRENLSDALAIERDIRSLQEKIAKIIDTQTDSNLIKRLDEFLQIFQLKEVSSLKSLKDVEILTPTPEDVAKNSTLVESSVKIKETGEILIDTVKKYLEGTNEKITLESIYGSLEEFQFNIIVRLLLSLGKDKKFGLDVGDSISKIRNKIDEYKVRINNMFTQKHEFELNSKIEKLFFQIHRDIDARCKRFLQKTPEKTEDIAVAMEKKPRENPVRRQSSIPGGPRGSGVSIGEESHQGFSEEGNEQFISKKGRNITKFKIQKVLSTDEQRVVRSIFIKQQELFRRVLDEQKRENVSVEELFLVASCCDEILKIFGKKIGKNKPSNITDPLFLEFEPMIWTIRNAAKKQLRQQPKETIFDIESDILDEEFPINVQLFQGLSNSYSENTAKHLPKDEGVTLKEKDFLRNNAKIDSLISELKSKITKQAIEKKKAESRRLENPKAFSDTLNRYAELLQRYDKLLQEKEEILRAAPKKKITEIDRTVERREQIQQHLLALRIS